MSKKHSMPKSKKLIQSVDKRDLKVKPRVKSVGTSRGKERERAKTGEREEEGSDRNVTVFRSVSLRERELQ